MQNNRTQSFIQLAAIIGILIVVNILGNFFYTFIDLTEDKRFSLTEPTKQLVKEIDQKVFIDIYLEGEFPAGFRRLQQATTDILDRFRSLNKRIDYQLVDPNEGTVEQINQMREKLKAIGIFPMTLNVKGKTESSQQVIFPFASIRYKDRVTTVQLLENQRPGISQEVALNNAIALLEYKFADALSALQVIKRPYVVFLEGHGELNASERADFEKTLRNFYEVANLNLDSVTQISPRIDVLVLAKPRVSFPEKHKFLLDQYIMNGGNVVWLMDQLNVSLDSMRGKPMYIPMDFSLNLDNQLFKYGVRVNPDLVLDLECSKIPQVIGMQGNQPQYEFFDWYYHPMIAPTSDHPIVKNLDRIDLKFATTIDTVKTSTYVKKTILLTSSAKSRIQRPPAQLSFNILQTQPIVERFNKPNLPVAVLLEGKFPSVFEGRVTPEMMQGLNQLGQPFKPVGLNAKLLVVSDGDIAKNVVNVKQGTYEELGYNPFMRYRFANKEFLLNSIEFMLDNRGIIEARGKEFKLRLLDKVRAEQEKSYWQVINLVVPLIFLVFFGIGYNYLRRRKFAK